MSDGKNFHSSISSYSIINETLSTPFHRPCLLLVIHFHCHERKKKEGKKDEKRKLPFNFAQEICREIDSSGTRIAW